MIAPEAANVPDDIICSLSDKLYGKDVAKGVLRKLRAGRQLIYQHRDYCGVGICLISSGEQLGQVQILSVYDGYPASVLLRFGTSEHFIEWLAQQSDLSMSGCVVGSDLYVEDPWLQGNQRITLARLQSFIRC